jgi:archaellum component FlaF (FlaF/FlaG flagellin family)
MIVFVSLTWSYSRTRRLGKIVAYTNMMTIFKFMVSSWLVAAVTVAVAANEGDAKVQSTFQRTLTTVYTDQVVELELIDSITNKKVATLTNGTVYESASPAFNINAIVNGTRTKSVRVGYGSLATVNVENTAPFAFCPNMGPVFPKCGQLGYGTHVVSFTPFSERSATGARGSTFTVTFTIEPPNYDITLDLAGVPDADKVFFEKAAKRLEQVVTGDLPDVNASLVPSIEALLAPYSAVFPRAPNRCVYPKVIDDLYLCVTYTTNVSYPPNIDGFLAVFLPLALRSPGGLPAVSVVFVDSKQVPLIKQVVDFGTLVTQAVMNVMGKKPHTRMRLQ